MRQSQPSSSCSPRLKLALWSAQRHASCPSESSRKAAQQNAERSGRNSGLHLASSCHSQLKTPSKQISGPGTPRGQRITLCVCACMHALVCACVCAYACVFEPVNCEVQGQRNTTSHRRDGGQNFVNQDYNIQPQEVKSSVRGSPPPLTPTVHPSHLPPGGCCPNTTPPPPPQPLLPPHLPAFPSMLPFPHSPLTLPCPGAHGE